MTEGSQLSQLVLRYGTHFNIRLGEWLASIILVSLAILFFIAPAMFAISPQYFHVLEDFASQPGWGAILLSTGGARLIALWVNGRKPITPYIRMVLAFLSCFVWQQITVGLFLSGVPGLGWAVFPWLLALDMYNVFRSSADAREVFDTKRASVNGSKDTI